MLLVFPFFSLGIFIPAEEEQLASSSFFFFLM